MKLKLFSKDSPWTKKLNKREIIIGGIGIIVILFLGVYFELAGIIGGFILYIFLTRVIGKK